ncbi:MAG: transporter [Candidatus Omnitrophota bacterium]
MLYKKKMILFAINFLLIFVAADLFASHQDHHEEWNPVSAGPLTTWTAPLCGKNKFVIQPFYFYNRTRGVFNSDGHYDSLASGDKKYQYQEQLFMQYGLTDHLEIDAQAVYQQNFVKQGDLKAHSKGFGDSYLFWRYCFLEEDFLPHLTGIFQIKFPTGKYQKLNPEKLGTDLMGATSGGGSYDLGVGVSLTKKMKPFVLHFDTTYNFPQKTKIDDLKIQYANYLNYDFGIEYFLPKGFNLMLEFNGFLQGDRRQDKEKIVNSNIEYLTIVPGIGWSCQKIQFLLSYQRVLVGTNTDANDSVVFTFVYTF